MKSNPEISKSIVLFWVSRSIYPYAPCEWSLYTFANEFMVHVGITSSGLYRVITLYRATHPRILRPRLWISLNHLHNCTIWWNMCVPLNKCKRKTKTKHLRITILNPIFLRLHKHLEQVAQVRICPPSHYFHEYPQLGYHTPVKNPAFSPGKPRCCFEILKPPTSYYKLF